MKLTRIATLTFLAVTFALSTNAQSSIQDWRQVAGLKTKTGLFVETKDGKTIKGKFAALTTDALDLVKNGKTISVSKADIDRVYRARKKGLLKRILIGAAAGAGIGTGVGVIAVFATSSPLAAAAGFIYGIPIGAVIGGVTAKSKKAELLYIAP